MSEAMSELARIIEALLFLSPDPVSVEELAGAADAWPDEIAAGLAELHAEYEEGRHGLILKEVAGGLTLATDPVAESAAKRLLARPRTPPLTPAQSEALAIVAYLQPVSRPEMARIRGVSSDSATQTLLERGLIEESGRSQFGAVLYRTTPLFLKLFGLKSLDDLPEASQWDPSPEEATDLRDRLLKAGEQRAPAA
jgi:segregation and condensation protein B